jgi:L,D-peptidoglycan transpeptidase YkuD (ErfK/YbiS/YcfS/YnhG family)
MPVPVAGPGRSAGAERVLLAVAVTAVLAGLAPAPAEAAAGPRPERIRGLRGATQAIVVTSASWRDTHAVMRVYQRSGSRWRLVRGPMPARVGRNGFSAHRHEGDGTTPAGVLGFVHGFGSRPDPGMHGLGWRRLGPGSCWSGRRADYNRWVAGRRCTARDENLWRSRRVAYRYAAVIDFNYRRPVYGRGSGIFLHQQTGGPTAGCVSLRAADLVAVLRWMRPGVRVAMGPAGYVARL